MGKSGEYGDGDGMRMLCVCYALGLLSEAAVVFYTSSPLAIFVLSVQEIKKNRTIRWEVTAESKPYISK